MLSTTQHAKHTKLLPQQAGSIGQSTAPWKSSLTNTLTVVLVQLATSLLICYIGVCKWTHMWFQKRKIWLNTMSLAVPACWLEVLLGKVWCQTSLSHIVSAPTLIVCHTKASVNFGWLKTHLKLVGSKEFGSRVFRTTSLSRRVLLGFHWTISSGSLRLCP